MSRPKGSKNKKKPKPEYPVAEHSPVFQILLRIGDHSYYGEGPTALDALTALEKPVKVLNKGTLTVEMGGKKKTLFLMPQAMKRLFYPITRNINAKMLSMGLK